MGKGSGVFDGCIQTLLFVCFAVYGLMALGLVVMGAIYCRGRVRRRPARRP